MIVITTQDSFLSHSCPLFDDGYVGKQPMPLKEYGVEYWLKELQEAWIGALAATI